MPHQIQSLEALKQWNKNPTKEKPIVLEWFLNWFFEKLLDNNKYSEAIEARDTLIEFTMVCEKMAKLKAVKKIDENLDYYSSYVRQWKSNWATLKTRLIKQGKLIYQSKWLVLTNE